MCPRTSIYGWYIFVLLLYTCPHASRLAGTRFTFFTSTTVQILTQKRCWQDEAHKEALKKLGEILRLRDVVNLRGSLETPDVYWDLPELEGMYELIHREFELR